MTLHLSKLQSIFIHIIIIWQQDEMFVDFLVQLQIEISPDFRLFYRYYNFTIKHSLSIKITHHSYF